MLYSTKGTPPIKGPANAHTCPTCQRPKLVLFYSTVCTHCEEPPKGRFYRGYILWSDAHDKLLCSGARLQDYVWYSTEDARTYERNVTNANADIERRLCSVLSTQPFNWRYGNGLAVGLMMAERLVTVHKDHRFAPAPYNAFLMPANAKDGFSEIVTL
jgi:hypothetical protein